MKTIDWLYENWVKMCLSILVHAAIVVYAKRQLDKNK